MHHYIDLHTHTIKSDGTLPADKLIKHAIDHNIGTISITDHDSVEGIREIVSIKKNLLFSKIRIITGIEISAKYTGGSLHVLGYGIDIFHQPLLAKLKTFQEIRKSRNAKILKKLSELGINLSMKELDEDTQESQSQGRPHIARLLVKKKAVKDVNDAFNVYLAKGKKAFISKEVFTASQAISMIHEAGGIAILAHPATLNLKGNKFGDFLDGLILAGLDGIEVFAPIHSEQQTKNYLALAKKNNMLISGGSDYHGDTKPNIRIGECTLGNRLDIKSISQELIDRAI